MNMSDKDPDLLIEAYLDGMLSPEEERAVLQRLEEDRDYADRLQLAATIQESLRSLPTLHAPPTMIPEVMRKARRQARQVFWQRTREWFGALRALDPRPALATASLIAVIVASSVVGRPPASGPTDPEVALALEQIKWTLALVSEVGEEAALIVRDDILEPHVVAPMQQAMQSVFVEPPGVPQ